MKKSIHASFIICFVIFWAITSIGAERAKEEIQADSPSAKFLSPKTISDFIPQEPPSTKDGEYRCTSEPSCRPPYYEIASRGCDVRGGRNCYVCTLTPQARSLARCPSGWTASQMRISGYECRSNCLEDCMRTFRNSSRGMNDSDQLRLCINACHPISSLGDSLCTENFQFRISGVGWDAVYNFLCEIPEWEGHRVACGQCGSEVMYPNDTAYLDNELCATPVR